MVKYSYKDIIGEYAHGHSLAGAVGLICDLQVGIIAV